MSSHGIYKIGKIASLEYNNVIVNDAEIFEIIEFHFTKLPYAKSVHKYKVVGNAGFGYKIIQSSLNNRYTILTPTRTKLTKFTFDEIIGFHHSSDEYNKIYAIGFIGNRVYSIEMDGNITLLPYSKEEYLTMKHKYYESKQRIVITQRQLQRIITETLKRVCNII